MEEAKNMSPTFPPTPQKPLKFVNLDDSYNAKRNGKRCGVFVCLLMQHLFGEIAAGATKVA